MVVNDMNELASHPPEPPDSGSKEKILAAARTEFAREGLAGARVDRIAEHAGVNKAMIYYYFQSKENLHAEVIRFHVQQIAEIVRTRFEKPGTLEEYLAELLNGHVQLKLRTPEFIPIMLHELADPRPEFLDQMASLLIESGLPKVMRAKFEEGRKAVEIREFDPRQMVVSLVTMSIGYFIMSPIMDRVMHITDHERFVEERKHAILDLFMNGVRAR